MLTAVLVTFGNFPTIVVNSQPQPLYALSPQHAAHVTVAVAVGVGGQGPLPLQWAICGMVSKILRLTFCCGRMDTMRTHSSI